MVSSFILSKSICIKPKPNKTAPAINSPFNISGAKRAIKTRLADKINKALPTSPRPKMRSNPFLSNFLVAHIRPSTINFNRGTINNIATPAIINNGSARIINPANLSIDQPMSPSAKRPLVKASIFILSSSPLGARFNESIIIPKPSPIGSSAPAVILRTKASLIDSLPPPPAPAPLNALTSSSIFLYKSPPAETEAAV